MLRTTALPRAEYPEGSETRGQAPSYGPGFIKRMARVFKIPLIIGQQTTDYDRGIVVNHGQQMLMPHNSDFSPLFRGPIRNYFIRDWYWRGMWHTPYYSTFEDAMMPNAHVLPTVPGQFDKSQPGGVIMTARPRLTSVLRMPAWSITPKSEDATSTANA